MYCICTFPAAHIDINDYPAIEKWFKDASWSNEVPFRKGHLKLEQTGKKQEVDGKIIKSRKKTGNKWFETQDQISYMDDFNKQKICYQELSQGSTFYLDDTMHFVINNTGYILVGKNLDYLIHFLNSIIIEFSFKHFYSISLGNTGVRWLAQYINNLPIPLPTPELKKAIRTAKDVDETIFETFKLSREEIDFIRNSL